jgi:DNA-binding response OmpR family regulator
MIKRIIILEDEKEILELMEMALQEEGYEVISLDHHAPLEYLIEFAPELILADVRLSNGYGHILCHDLKANPVTSGIPVILISGADNLAKIAEECQADDYLPKPFGIEDLISIVKHFN